MFWLAFELSRANAFNFDNGKILFVLELKT